MVERNSPEKVKPSNNMLIAVMGPSGCAKSTFAGLIEKDLGFDLISETPVDEMPFFDKYCENPEKYALAFQVNLLNLEWEKLVGDKKKGIVGVNELLENNHVVIEPPIWQHAIYAKARLENSPLELEEYERFYHSLIDETQIPKPDVVVYLKPSFPTMMSAIEERARKNRERAVEGKVKQEYWMRLWELNQEWAKENNNSYTIIDINRDVFDGKKWRGGEEEANKALLNEMKIRINYFVENHGWKNERIQLGKKIPKAIRQFKIHHSYEIDKTSPVGDVYDL